MLVQSEAEQLWESVKKALKSMLNDEIYSLWFAPVRAMAESSGGKLVLEVPNDFCEVWIRDNYSGLLRDVVNQCAKEVYEIDFVVAPVSQLNPKAGQETAPKQKTAPEERRTQPASRKRAPEQFNPNYTFETLVVSKSNEMAHSATIAVAQAPGKAYNPLFIYGGVGLGKTHMLHAIGQYVVEHRPHANVTYLSCEKFTNEFIDGLQNNQLMRFRKKYRQTDVLLLDDVHFLSGKERIQEEFFHTFNALHEGHKQIVITSDRPPCEIGGLEQRLVSRFEWGLATDLQAPDVETRLAILRKKAKSLNAELPSEIFDFLADRIRANIRRLEGALIRAASYSKLTGRELTIDTVENLLRDVLQEEGKTTVTIDSIQKRVAGHFDIRLADMSSRRRPENIAFPRQIAMFLSRQLTGNSLNSIGEAFGGRDHGTVLHACRLVKDRMDTDQNIRQVVAYLEKQLQR
jgi:chromosomal replication initiator protein